MKIRLAMREEGTFWNAYLAQSNTMEGALLIGSISIGAARKSPDVKEAFLLVMQQVIADAIEEMTGKPPDEWERGPAPEAERARH